MYLNKNFLEQLKEERKTYKLMIEFCCDSMILNNCIMQELLNNNYYFDIFCGNDREFTNENGDYISEEEFYKLQEEGKEGEEMFLDIFQYFIINYQDAERIATYTNEIVYYNEELDLYILGVTHCGTGWDYVPANWKDINEEESEEE